MADILNDEQMDQLSSTAAISDEEMDRMSAGVPDKLTGYTRAAAQGVSFGFADEMEAGLRTGLGWLGDYGKTRDEIRKSNKAFSDAYPVSSTAVELVGSLPTAAVPGLGWGNVGRAAGQGAMAVTKAAIPAGAKTGAIYGAGVSEGDARTAEGASQMGKDALVHSGVGAITGPVGAVAGQKIGEVGGRIAGAVRNVWQEASGTAEDKALRVAKRAWTQDGVDPDKTLQSLLPDYGRGANAMPRDRIEEILTVYGEGLGNQLDETSARAVAVQRLVSQGVPQSTAVKQVREVVSRYDQMHQVPMQVHELPALASEAATGKNSNALMRVAANRMNDGSEPFNAAVRERQLGLGETMEGIVSRALGGRSADDIIRDAGALVKSQNSALYKTAHEADEAARLRVGLPGAVQPGHLTPAPTTRGLPMQHAGIQPVDISPDIIAMQMRAHEHAGHVRSGMEKALELFFDPDGRTGTKTLQQFMNQREALRDLIEAANRDGHKTLGRELTIFYKEISKRVAQQNPEWEKANQAAAKAFSDERVLETAKKLTLKAGPGQREALREFEAASPEAQDLVRVKVAQMIADQLVNNPRTGNVGKLFNTPASRRTLERVFGQREAADMLAHADRVALASRTHHQLNGQSQTAPMQEWSRVTDLAEKLKQMIRYASPSRWTEGLGEYAANRATGKRDAALLDLYGRSTERPDLMIDALRRLQSTQLPQDLPPPNLAAPFSAIGGYGGQMSAQKSIKEPLEVYITGDDVARHKRGY